MLWLLDLRWWGVAAAFAMLASAGSYIKGYRDADRSATIEMLTSEIRKQLAEKEELRRQAAVAQDVAKKAAEREMATIEMLADVKEQVDEYARLLADQPSQPNCDCSLSPDDARRLRGIGSDGRGQADAPGAPRDIRSPRSSPVH